MQKITRQSHGVASSDVDFLGLGRHRRRVSNGVTGSGALMGTRCVTHSVKVVCRPSYDGGGHRGWRRVVLGFNLGLGVCG
ncbi:hypothetical protein TB2_022450 [Malus domestica]